MTDTTTRRALYLALMTDGVPGSGHSPDRSERATALIEAFRDEDRALHRELVLREAAEQQRAAAKRLPEHVAAAAPLIGTVADLIDPSCRALFKPARIRDAADLLLAARTTTAQES